MENQAEKNYVLHNSPGQVWDKYIDAWNRHHVADVLACVSPDFVYDERPMTMEHTLKGREVLAAYLKDVFHQIPDLHIELLTLEEGTNSCWSESVMTGTFVKHFFLLPPFSRKIKARVACAFTAKGGLLTEERLYWDKGNTLRQLGFVPSLFGVISKPVWWPTGPNPLH